MTPEGRFAAALEDIFPAEPPRRLAVAVSGGGDSMALMHLAARWAANRSVAVGAVTVDHGLRPEAADEARLASEAAARLGLAHATLRWSGWDGFGNLQDAARRARRELVEAWARPLSFDAILTGHTMDDQAETVLMRLARGSGVDGLCGMPQVRRWGVTWARPLLGMRRVELREWLAAAGVAWTEDSSNEDPRFDRVRARRLLADLSDLGLTVERLDATARHMRLAREVLVQVAQDLADRAARVEAGDLLIETAAFRRATDETRMRLLAAALQWISGAPYRPRYAALERLAQEGGALHGCILSEAGGALRVTRELAAVRGLATPTDVAWDGRWRLDGPHARELEVRPLDQGLALCPNRGAAGLPTATLRASPAVWRGADLVAAPLARLAAGWTATLVPGRDEFSIWEITR